MADVSVTVGANTTELEKKVKEAGKTIKKGLSGGDEVIMKGIDFGSNLMAGNVGTAIGSLFGPLGTAIGGFVDQLLTKANQMIERSREFRNLSIATGLTTKELEGLENLAKVTGTSLHTLANAFAEFNVKVATSKIKGSELNNVFAKMNVNFKDVTEGTFTATDGLKKLADAYTAGTDAQTLAYYGNLMYGSSFKDLLPIVKQGSVGIEKYTKILYKSTKELDDANASAADSLSNLGHSFLNFITDFIGVFTFGIDKVRQTYNELEARMSSDTSKKVTNFISNNPNLSSKELIEKASGFKGVEEIKKYYALGADRQDQKQFLEELKKQAGGNGTKLTPFGQSLAGAASSMQEMGGGDIFGAVSFSPLQRIADATEETAKNTAPKTEQEQVPNPFITNINAQ